MAAGQTLLTCDLIVRGIGELVTMSSPHGLGIVADAAVAARDGRIVWVGAEAGLAGSVATGDDALVVDAEGASVVPGFVDAHTHTVFAGERAGEYAARLGGAGYLEIQAAGGGIMATVRATRAASEAELASLVRRRLDSLLAHGTTTLEIKSGYGLRLEDEAKVLAAARTPHPANRVYTQLAAHSLPAEWAGRDDEFIDYICNDVTPALAGQTEFIDVFCDEGAFTVAQSRRVLETGLAHGYRVKIHAEELAHSGGAALAAELGAVSADHLIFATAEDIASLRAAGTTPVLLPGTSYTLHTSYAPARAFLDAGATIALATDFNPGTCNCENLQLIVSLACQEMRLTPDEALYAATMGGATALGLQDDVGSIEVGKRCDLVILAAETHFELPYHFGVNLVDGVIVGGEIVVRGGVYTGGPA